MLIDTHCHLNHEQFQADLLEVIERALAAGVERMIVVGFDLPSSEEAVRLADSHLSLYAAIGVHPHEARIYGLTVEERLMDLSRHPKVVAIGEIGLDYHYDFSPRHDQKVAFRAQLALASAVELPVIIHCREAYPDVLDELAQAGVEKTGGVMHCWTGTASEAEWALGLGLYMGFGGVLTFKNADALWEIAASAPLSRILVETDAPYLAPVPHRGKRNEPAYARLVAEKLAQVRAVALEEIESETTINARKLFSKIHVSFL
ncbi:MAG TPA: TatD family hydrolase [Chthonomonadales bacterium]|nr:TatD family hydrolase [Chthonomonadales bacterium]